MVEYSADDEYSARNTVEMLLSDERKAIELDNELSIFDIEKDAAEFRADLDILSIVGADVPALRIGDDGSVPVSLSSLGLWPSLRSRGLFWRHRYFRELLYYLREDIGSLGEVTISREEARSSFLRRATSFLASRIAGIRMFRHGETGFLPPTTLNILQRSGGARITTPGCAFSVSSNSSGLRVFWSGAYYISPNYFGHPTSPTVSVLQSGTYIFGVDGGAYSDIVQWDTSAVCSLPGKPFVHLNY